MLNKSGWRLAVIATALVTLQATALASKRGPAFQPAADLAALDQGLDWSRARLIVVQEGGRYKTIESFARESFAGLTANQVESLPELSAPASMFEWLFNMQAYMDAPVLRVKDKGLQIHFTAHLPEDDPTRLRVRATGYFTPREYFSREVQARKRELQARVEMNSAMNRVFHAEAVLVGLDQLLRLVPRPNGDMQEKWFTIEDLQPNLPGELGATSDPDAKPAPGIDQDTALRVVATWASLRKAWLDRDVVKTQKYLDQLAEVLPPIAGTAYYPSLGQRQAEAQYYAMKKFTGGWMIYLLAFVVSIFAMVTRWKTPYAAAWVLAFAALGFHAYGLGLRWYILGRIPVANMFEAVVASAWMGIAIALVLELVYRWRFLLVSACAAGFFSLVLAGYVIPGGGTLTTIQGILDDVMLRIHTVLIILSYALIFLASVIAVIYIFGYYMHTDPGRSAQSGSLFSMTGAVLWVLARSSFASPNQLVGASGIVKLAGVSTAFGVLSVAAAVLLLILIWRRSTPTLLISTVALLLASGSLAIGSRGFVVGVAQVMLFGGLAWLVLTALGAWVLRLRTAPAGRPVAAKQDPALALAGGMPTTPERLVRPVMAGGAPGDERGGLKLPTWLHHADWCHLIILNLVFITLFVGIILGAVWADYSWGRPWGWDPKEVFAMNTWIIYAILIHIRFVTKLRGLWTAWLSVAGCLMMAFNWAFVNFFIVGLHSYA